MQLDAGKCRHVIHTAPLHETISREFLELQLSNSHRTIKLSFAFDPYFIYILLNAISLEY